MKKRIHIGESHYLDFELSAWQLVVIIMMFMVMLVVPVYAYGRLSADPVQQEATTAVTGGETYTAEALGQGRVAGATTGPESSYITIPILEIEFDTSLNDPDSMPILLGGILTTISAGLFIYMLLETLFGR